MSFMLRLTARKSVRARLLRSGPKRRCDRRRHDRLRGVPRRRQRTPRARDDVYHGRTRRRAAGPRRRGHHRDRSRRRFRQRDDDRRRFRRPGRAVDQALAAVRGDGGRTIIGVDPGRKPGIAVLAGETVVAAFQVPLGDAVDLIQREAAEAPSPVVRIGDGSRLESAKLVTDLDDVRVELVDETGTTPTLAPGREEWVTCSLRSISLGSRGGRRRTRDRSD